jgi:hypothetical protein
METEVAYNRYDDNANWSSETVRTLPPHSGFLGTPELTICLPNFLGFDELCSSRKPSHSATGYNTAIRARKDAGGASKVHNTARPKGATESTTAV